MKKLLLELIKKELKENKLFSIIFVESVELYPAQNSYDDLRKRYYNNINILESYCEYIEFSSIIFDINKLIVKRFNDVLTLENILKCLDILAIKE